MSKQATETITMYSVGDVRIAHNDPGFILQFIKPTMSEADIATCQLETIYSNRGERDPHARIPFRAPPEGAAGLKDAGFDVITVAGNHCMDYGHEALLDTIEALKAAGLAPIGTGRNLEEAEKPVIMERGGNKVGFLSYNSIMAEEWCAQSDRPGCNPIKIYSSDGKFNSGETGGRTWSDWRNRSSA
jgi:poly-gamma-glutamate capsule biosynthesis protein CapA/YwtB (metallophosphatase superfamily)